MAIKRLVSGNYAAAFGALRAKVKFIAAFPITPQTFIVEHISEFVNDGIMDAEFMRVESEHSAISATVSAEATGVRSFTATASQGLALMHEILAIPAPLRLPIVMPVVNRTVAAPIGIWAEYNDVMPQRDLGWMMMFVEDNQEVFDMVIQGYKIAEDKRVLLPFMPNLDAFILSHTYEPVEFPDQEEIDAFLPEYKAEHAHLWPDDPMAIGVFAPPEYIQEYRTQTENAMENAGKVIKEVNDEFAKTFGRDYHGLIEEFMTEDAEAVMITLGTVTSTARKVVMDMRKEGKKVGLVKLRFLRPFPREELRKVAEKVDAIGVYDKSISYSAGGPVFIETRNALYGMDKPVIGYLAGLGGRDVKYDDIKLMFEKTLEAAKKGKADKEVVWVGTRGVNP